MATLETWNGRTSGQTDADSPLDTTLMDGIRKDLDHLKQVLYGNSEGSGTYFTAAWGHDHNGTNSKNVTLADASVSYKKLKLEEEIFIEEDFLLENSVASTHWSKFGATFVNNSVNGEVSLSPGYFINGTTTNGKTCKLSASELTIGLRVKYSIIITSDSACISRFGFFDGISDLNPSNGVYFRKSGTSSYQWIAVTRASGTETATTLDVSPVANTYDKLKIVATTTSVKFYINGTLKATHTTNIPTANMVAGLHSNYITDPTVTVTCDYIYFHGTR